MSSAIDNKRAGSATARLPCTHLGSIGFNQGLLLGRRQTIRRPFGTSEQLAKRRQRALQMLRNGQRPQEIAEQIGTTERSVRRWHQEFQAPKPKRSRRRPGRPARLSEQQLERLVQELQRGAYVQGYAEDYWTLDRISRLIWDLFRVRYHPSAVWHLLRRLGWSCQKPQRRGLARDQAAVQNWRRHTWFRIKKLA